MERDGYTDGGKVRLVKNFTAGKIPLMEADVIDQKSIKQTLYGRHLPSLREIDRAIYAKSHYEFTKAAWKIVEPERPFIDSFHVGCVAEHLQAVTEGQIKKLIINEPPRHGKSLQVCVFWFCWDWARRAANRWLYVSYSDDLVTRDSQRCKKIIKSDWFQKLWGDKFKLSGRDTLNWFENDKTGSRICSTVEGAATGQGGDYVCVDDPMKAGDVSSPAAKLRVTNWYFGTMTTRTDDPVNQKRVVTMQRLDEGDLTGVIMARDLGYETLIFPARYEQGRISYDLAAPKKHKYEVKATKLQIERPELRDPRTEDGQILCPKRFPEEALQEWEKSLGAEATAGQLQQRPAPSEGMIFRKELFRYFGFENRRGVPGVVLVRKDSKKFWPIESLLFFQTVDTAVKIKQKNDFTAVATSAITPDSELLVWNMYRAKIETPYQYRFLRACYKGKTKWDAERREALTLEAWPKQPMFQAIEDAATGPGLVAQGRLDGMQMREMSAAGDKAEKCATLAIMYEQENVFHMQGAEWLMVYEDEVLVFPNGAHDDLLDCAGRSAHLGLNDKIIKAGMLGLSELAKELEDKAARERGTDAWKLAPDEYDVSKKIEFTIKSPFDDDNFYSNE